MDIHVFQITRTTPFKPSDHAINVVCPNEGFTNVFLRLLLFLISFLDSFF